MMIRRCFLLVLCLSAVTVAAGTAFAGGANPNFTLPLHAKVSSFEGCTGYLPVDCLGVRPTVSVQSGQPVAVFLLVANYSQISGIQTAFEVGPSWTFSFSLWDCLIGEIADVNPLPPFGPTSGSLVAAFNCVTSGGLISLGRMFFTSGTGCIAQIESAFPYGTFALDCQQQVDRILVWEPGQTARLGKICVGPGGQDACAAVTAVSAVTWGRIKASYR